MGLTHYTESRLAFQPLPTVHNFQDITNQQFHRLKILGYAGNTYWYCKCDCGSIVKVGAGHLKNGHTKSCGCYKLDKAKQRNIYNSRFVAEYAIYHRAKARCRNPKLKKYASYGGRGIKFCFDSFADFIKEVGFRPSKKHSLDRIDNNKHYEVGNLRWTTYKNQARNTRRNRILELDGVRKSLAEWSEIRLIPYGTIKGRLRSGFCDRCALSQGRKVICVHKVSGKANNRKKEK